MNWVPGDADLLMILLRSNQNPGLGLQYVKTAYTKLGAGRFSRAASPDVKRF
jgi:hypothetical protein